MRQEIREVCEKVRSSRFSKGVSILELAERADISHSAVYYIESQKKEPTLETLFKIAKALDMDIKEFF